MPATKIRTVAVVSAVLVSLGGGAIATAASQNTDQSKTVNPNEKALTGDTAAKVKAAALEKLPGATVLRVETDEGGVYEAHVRKSDGTEAEVHVGEDFQVSSVDTRPAGGPGRGGHGGPGGPKMDTAALATALGVTEAKLNAALDATRPAKGGKDAKHAERAAAIAKVLGASQADVQAVLDANRPARPTPGSTPPARPAQPDDSKLVAALADKFGVSEAKAQAALDAGHLERGEHESEMAAALAKELGLDAAKVKAALEAQRPQAPANP
jgi:hypothetical protein